MSRAQGNYCHTACVCMCMCVGGVETGRSHVCDAQACDYLCVYVQYVKYVCVCVFDRSIMDLHTKHTHLSSDSMLYDKSMIR